MTFGAEKHREGHLQLALQLVQFKKLQLLARRFSLSVRSRGRVERVISRRLVAGSVGFLTGARD